MSLLEWSDRLSVGVPQFDAQHRQLVALINELFEAMTQGTGNDTLGRILGRLVAYTAAHFASEEKLMAQAGFAGLAEHRKEHESFTRRVLDVEARYNAGASAALGVEVLQFLKTWLVHHIQGTDTKYAACFTGAGRR